MTQDLDVAQIGDDEIKAGRKGREAVGLDVRTERVRGAEGELVASLDEGLPTGKCPRPASTAWSPPPQRPKRPACGSLMPRASSSPSSSMIRSPSTPWWPAQG
jgi:hypothetical protein